MFYSLTVKGFFKVLSHGQDRNTTSFVKPTVDWFRESYFLWKGLLAVQRHDYKYLDFCPHNGSIRCMLLWNLLSFSDHNTVYKDGVPFPAIYGLGKYRKLLGYFLLLFFCLVLVFGVFLLVSDIFKTFEPTKIRPEYSYPWKCCNQAINHVFS